MDTTKINLTKLRALVKKSKLSESHIALESITHERVVSSLIEGTRAEINRFTLGRILETLGSDIDSVLIQ